MDAGTMGEGHPVFAALYARLAPAFEAGRIGIARRELLAQASGVVLDLGAGTGANLPHLSAEVAHVHLVEPDPHMIARLGSRLPMHATVHRARGEHLPLPDDSVDTVLATLTLCTVQDVPRVLGEIRRVLRPGGRVLVLEHVVSTRPITARCQRALAVPWRWAGAGCHPDRDTTTSFERAGFETSGLSRFRVRGALLAPDWVTGVLT